MKVKHRYLIKANGSRYEPIYEVICHEISDEHIKIEYIESGHISWIPKSDISDSIYEGIVIIEDLGIYNKQQKK